MKMSPYVDVEVKMPKDMLYALTKHEFYCIGNQIKTVTKESVQEFLLKRYSQSMALKFKPEFLISIQET